MRAANRELGRNRQQERDTGVRAPTLAMEYTASTVRSAPRKAKIGTGVKPRSLMAARRLASCPQHLRSQARSERAATWRGLRPVRRTGGADDVGVCHGVAQQPLEDDAAWARARRRAEPWRCGEGAPHEDPLVGRRPLRVDGKPTRCSRMPATSRARSPQPQRPRRRERRRRGSPPEQQLSDASAG